MTKWRYVGPMRAVSTSGHRLQHGDEFESDHDFTDSDWFEPVKAKTSKKKDDD